MDISFTVFSNSEDKVFIGLAIRMLNSHIFWKKKQITSLDFSRGRLYVGKVTLNIGGLTFAMVSASDFL